jgi:hypothetical protein
MRNRTIVLLLLAAIAGLAMSTSVVCAATSGNKPAATADEEWSAAPDVAAFLSKAREAAAQPSTKVAPVRAAYYHSERQCARYSFAPDDNPVGRWSGLYSRTWYERCENIGDPRRGGGRHCWQEPGPSYSESVRVTLKDRQRLFPWEYDSFSVCLEGPWLSIHSDATAYEYKVQRGNHNGDYVLTPVKKIRMRPDPTGILAEPLSPQMKLALKDKWASYYTGETTVLKLTVKQDVPNWFDPTIGELELKIPAAERYGVDLVSALGNKLEAGKKYYVKVSFQRVGNISKPDMVSSGETAPVRYAPVVELLAAF